MKKVLKIKRCIFTWQIDASAIADHRAKYYAEEDSDTTYQEEYDFCMSENYQILDWYSNNMDWKDIPEKNKKMLPYKIPSSPDSCPTNFEDNCDSVVEIQDDQ